MVEEDLISHNNDETVGFQQTNECFNHLATNAAKQKNVDNEREDAM
jgi:hypothetical protein